MPVTTLENPATAHVQMELEQKENSRIRPFLKDNNQMQFSSCDPKPHPNGFYIRVLAPSVLDLNGKYITSHVFLFSSAADECSTLTSNT
jgi:hypothetical protein